MASLERVSTRDGKVTKRLAEVASRAATAVPAARKMDNRLARVDNSRRIQVGAGAFFARPPLRGELSAISSISEGGLSLLRTKALWRSDYQTRSSCKDFLWVGPAGRVPRSPFHNLRYDRE